MTLLKTHLLHTSSDARFWHNTIPQYFVIRNTSGNCIKEICANDISCNYICPYDHLWWGFCLDEK
jgi:hypothetical protein